MIRNGGEIDYAPGQPKIISRVDGRRSVLESYSRAGTIYTRVAYDDGVMVLSETDKNEDGKIDYRQTTTMGKPSEASASVTVTVTLEDRNFNGVFDYRKTETFSRLEKDSNKRRHTVEERLDEEMLPREVWLS